MGKGARGRKRRSAAARAPETASPVEAEPETIDPGECDGAYCRNISLYSLPLQEGARRRVWLCYQHYQLALLEAKQRHLHREFDAFLDSRVWAKPVDIYDRG